MESSLAANYYDVLGIGPAASLADIKAAYARQVAAFREKMLMQEAPAAEAFDELRQAFRVLGDPLARQAYDASLKQGPLERGDSDAAPPMLPGAAAEASGGGREIGFRFAGEGGEYFRIWIVNILLTVVTLGIYSAWAKVRREQYFHRNLMLDGSGFDYHGRPAAILKGRLVAFALLAGLSIAQRISPLAYGAALLGLLPLLPWLAVKALRFRAHNTSYRGLRFSFHGRYGQACKVFIGYGLLSGATLGLAFPLFYRALRKFMLDNTRFGTTPFACNVTNGAIYRIFLLPGALLVALFASLILVGALAAGHGGNLLLLGAFVMAIPLLLLLAAQAVVVPYMAARTANVVWGNTRLGRHRFASYLPVGSYIGLTLSNWLGIAVTLGLFIPWARVRLARFRAEHLALAVEESLDDFVAGEAAAANAVGDEAAEMFDLDIGL